MTHPDHPLHDFKKRLKRAQMTLLIAEVILLPVLFFFFYGIMNEMMGKYLAIAFMIGLFAYFVIVSFNNIVDLNRCRFHRFFGQQDELEKILDCYFASTNLQYIKVPDYAYKMPLWPKKLLNTKYDFGSFSVLVYKWPNRQFCDIRIISDRLQESIVDNIEEQIYNLIKDKRGFE